MTHILRFSALFGFLGVATGAFATHGLKNTLPVDLLEIFATGSRYCLLHALPLMVIALSSQKENIWLQRASLGFIIGTIIFAGSLWTLALSGLRWFGAITPIGGLGLLYGWVCVFLSASSIKKSTDTHDSSST